MTAISGNIEEKSAYIWGDRGVGLKQKEKDGVAENLRIDLEQSRWRIV